MTQMKQLTVQAWLKRAITTLVLGVTSFSLIGLAQAEKFGETRNIFEAHCSGLERTHVDCGCVGKRIATFLHVSPNEDFNRMTEARYKVSLGISADREGATEAAFGSDEKFLNIVAAYAPYGGHEIEYEEGCVIQGAAPTPLASFPPDDVYRRSFDACKVSTGMARWCQCDTAARAQVLAPEEFEANYLAFSDYQGSEGSMEAMTAMRAEKMGLSPEAYRALTNSASAKLEAQTDDDGAFYFSNRCHAMTYGEDTQSGALLAGYARSDAERAGPPLGLENINVTTSSPSARAGADMMADVTDQQQAAFDEAIRQSDGVEEELRAIQNSSQLAQIKDGSNLSSAASVVERGCTGEAGRSRAYCQCFAGEFDRRVPAAMSEGGRRMTAMMFVGSGLSPAEAAQITTNSTEAEQMEAAMAFPNLMDIPQTCEARAQAAGVDAAVDGARSVRRRYLAICGLEHGDEAGSLCTCAADYFEGDLNENEWSMLIDIQVSDMKGEDDAFAKYASDIGLTQEEAEQAIMNNPRLLQSIMGMGATCMASGLGFNR